MYATFELDIYSDYNFVKESDLPRMPDERGCEVGHKIFEEGWAWISDNK